MMPVPTINEDIWILSDCKAGFLDDVIRKLKSWIRIYTPIRRFVNILTTFLCPSFTCFAHVLMLRNITASLTCGLWLKWQTCLWLFESQAETLAGRQYVRRKPEVEECVAEDSIRVFGYTVYRNVPWKWGHTVAQLVGARRYKPEGRGFIEIFHWHNPSGRTVDLASNRNEYQEYFLWVKADLTTDGPEILRASTFWKPQGLPKYCFTFTLYP